MTQTVEKFEVRNRWTGAVQFTAEISVTPEMTPYVKLGLAVKWGQKNGAVLRGAVLCDAVLRGAVLCGAVLRGADLSDADLRGADLSGADLSGADLRGADLSDAVLRGAVLCGADLSDADLRGADLSDADLRGAVLRSLKADLWMTLTQARPEIPAFIQSMLDGLIDGSQYEGECACLVGTLSNIRGKNFADAFPDHSSSNPAEQWFLMIRKGDKPGDDTGGGFAIGKALQWTLDYCEVSGVKLPAALKKAALAALEEKEPAQ
jgi:hypothetical protein